MAGALKGTKIDKFINVFEQWEKVSIGVLHQMDSTLKFKHVRIHTQCFINKFWLFAPPPLPTACTPPSAFQMGGSISHLVLQGFAEIEHEAQIGFELKKRQTGHVGRKRQGFSDPKTKKTRCKGTPIV